jgi:NADH-quinone oxidoreductase subunit F
MAKEINIKVCMGTGGIAAGGSEVMQAFKDEFKKKDIKASVGKHCSMHNVGCRGLCAKDVLVDVLINGDISTYQFIQSDMVPRLVEEHLVGGKPVEEWLVGKDYHNFHDNQDGSSARTTTISTTIRSRSCFRTAEISIPKISRPTWPSRVTRQ